MLSAMPVTSPPHVAPGRWSALAGLATGLFFTMAPWFSAAALLPQLRELWTLTDVASAWLTLAVQLGFVLGAVLSAALNLADRVTPQRLILAGGLLAAASNLGLLFVSGLVSATLLRALTGAALALVYPSALKAMSAWFVTGRGVALGVMVGGLTLGSALPHLINGFGGANWRVVIVTTSVLAALGGLIAAQVGEGPYQFPAAVFQPAQAWRMLSGRGMRLATLGYLGHMWELYAMWASPPSSVRCLQGALILGTVKRRSPPSPWSASARSAGSGRRPGGPLGPDTPRNSGVGMFWWLCIDSGRAAAVGRFSDGLAGCEFGVGVLDYCGLRSVLGHRQRDQRFRLRWNGPDRAVGTGLHLDGREYCAGACFGACERLASHVRGAGPGTGGRYFRCSPVVQAA